MSHEILHEWFVFKDRFSFKSHQDVQILIKELPLIF